MWQLSSEAWFTCTNSLTDNVSREAMMSHGIKKPEGNKWYQSLCHKNQASLGWQYTPHKNDIKPHAEYNTAGLWSGYLGRKAGQNDVIYKCNLDYSSISHISATVQENRYHLWGKIWKYSWFWWILFFFFLLVKVDKTESKNVTFFCIFKIIIIITTTTIIIKT